MGFRNQEDNSRVVKGREAVSFCSVLERTVFWRRVRVLGEKDVGDWEWSGFHWRDWGWFSPRAVGAG
jgi:hypothetical protein